MAWFWFAIAMLLMAWNAYLMLTNSMARYDLRRARRDLRRVTDHRDRLLAGLVSPPVSSAQALAERAIWGGGSR